MLSTFIHPQDHLFENEQYARLAEGWKHGWKFYKMAVRAAVPHGLETVALTKRKSPSWGCSEFHSSTSLETKLETQGWDGLEMELPGWRKRAHGGGHAEGWCERGGCWGWVRWRQMIFCGEKRFPIYFYCSDTEPWNNYLCRHLAWQCLRSLFRCGWNLTQHSNH